ncbi:MAG: hypothetical protein ACFFB5_05330 [Promethearchaeota archaeon]
MRSHIRHYNRNSYRIQLILSCLLLLILIYSIPSGISQRSKLDLITTSKFEEITNESFNYEKMTQKAYNYLENHWNPQKTAQSWISDDLPTMEDAFRSTFFDNMLESAISNELQTTTSSQPRSHISTKITPLSEGGEVVEHTQISGKPKIRLDVFNQSILDDIIIPVRSISDIKVFQPEYTTVEKEVKIGFEFDLPKIDEEIIFKFSIFRFRAWAKFEFRVHFVFPVKLRITYPVEVIEGYPYDFTCQMIPWNLPSYNEFEFLLDFDFGAAAEIKVFGAWRKLVGKSLAFNFHKAKTFTTPLGKTPMKIGLPDIDIIEKYIDYYLEENEENVSKRTGNVLKILKNVVGAGIGLGTINFYGDMVSAKLGVYTDIKKIGKRGVAWTKADEKRSFRFSIAQATGEAIAKFVKFEITDLLYHLRVTWRPNLFFTFKNIKYFGIKVPLKDWLGEYRLHLPEIPIGKIWLIPSLFSYSTSGSYTTAWDAYGFSATFEELPPYEGQGILSNIRVHDYMYKVKVRNLGTRTDLIRLEVLNLPPGYKVFTNSDSKYFTISPTAREIDVVISAPDRISVPPGPWKLSFKVTSISLEILKYSTPSISSQEFQIEIPHIIDMDFELDHDMANIFNVTRQKYNSIAFYGGNGGNLNDTIIVNASLITDRGNRTLLRSFKLDPWASGPGEHFQGEFGFYFDLNNLYPSPGYYLFEIQARSARDPNVQIEYKFFMDFPQVHSVIAELTPKNVTIFADWGATFTLQVNNTGNYWDNFSLICNAGDLDGYLDFPDEILNLGFLEVEEVSIVLAIPDPSIIPAMVANMRIITQSQGKQSVYEAEYANTKILEADDVPPGINYIEPMFSSDNLTLPQSLLTLGPSWKAIDEYPGPGAYTIYIDGIVPAESWATGSWSMDIPVQVPMTDIYSLPIGIYNVTIEFSDEAGNTATDQVWVNITSPDNTLPILTPITTGISFPINFVNERLISWYCEEAYPLNLIALLDDIEIPDSDLFTTQYDVHSKSWITSCILKPGTLPVGTYNFTVILQDMGDNIVISSIFVDITTSDNEVPIMIGTTPLSVAIHGQDETVSINFTDDNPDNYEFWINSILEDSGHWEAGVALSYEAESLSSNVGENNFTFVVYDLAGHQTTHQWTFTWRDLDPPTVLITPTDSTFYEHNITQAMAPYWMLEDYDIRPGSYKIYKNNIVVEEGIWNRGNGTIFIPTVNITPGIYEFHAEFRDATGNLFPSPSVTLSILDILDPFILPIESIDYEPPFAPSWFEFIVVESYLSNYQLYINDIMVQEDTISSDFPILFINLEETLPGDYNYTLIVTDESGNIGKESVSVQMHDYTPPLIRIPANIIYSEGTTGHAILWEIIEANPLNYSVYCNGALITSGTDLSLNFTLSVDGLTLGSYEYVILVYDESGMSHTSSCYVTVVDVTKPALIHVGDCRFVSGDENAEIIWRVDDPHPESYTIFLDGETLLEETWNGNDITLSLIGWSPNNYTLRLQVFDTSGNHANDEIKVEIIEFENEEEYVEIATAFSLPFVLICLMVLRVINKSRNREDRIKKLYD